MTTAILATFSGWFLINALFVVVMSKAPLGYEDKRGFHLGSNIE